jgi:hypothetical protein
VALPNRPKLAKEVKQLFCCYVVASGTKSVILHSTAGVMMQGNAASVGGGAEGDSDNVLEVLDEENPNTSTKVSTHVPQTTQVEHL